MILLRISFFFSTYLENKKEFAISENGKFFAVFLARSSRTNYIRMVKAEI